MSPSNHDCPDCLCDLDDEPFSLSEWFWETGFNVIMWVIVISLAIGVSGGAFFVGILGYVKGLALLR